MIKAMAIGKQKKMEKNILRVRQKVQALDTKVM